MQILSNVFPVKNRSFFGDSVPFDQARLQCGDVSDKVEKMETRLKVLLSAYACEPGKGSEPGVGWNLAIHMSRLHDVWVLTRANNRVVIEEELQRNPVANLHFCYHDLPVWARFWKRGPRGVQLYYYLWQLTGVRVVRALHRRVGFHLAHHVTFVKYWMPSCVAFLRVPFIWGPVGGGVSAPLPFWRELGLSGVLYEALRTVGRWVGEHDPLVRLTAQRAAIVLSTTQETAVRITRLGAKRVKMMLEAALPQNELDQLGRIEAPKVGPFRFVYIGRLLPLKGQHLALRAFALAKLPDAEYWIIGGGPAQTQLENLATELNIKS
ncbi:MAG: glycosyltransferase, partial [Verrucomicrobiae bacterium]|nr:glycosyltransferase [Verrucomicrobiae bacterium]